jgi:hypothetical protein
LKKPIAAALLVLLFTAQAGYYFIYSVHQHFIKEEIEQQLLARIPESSLEIIVADQVENKIVWKEKGKEFSLDGVMYDIARVKRSHGKTLLYCINDKKERQLLDDLANAVRNNHNSKQERNNVKCPISDFYFVGAAQELNIVSKPSAYFYFNETPVTSFEDVNIQPPRI